MQERVMFGPIFEPAIPPWCWSAGGGACDRVELPALLPRALRGHAPQEALRGSLINPDGVRWRVAFIISSPRNRRSSTRQKAQRRGDHDSLLGKTSRQGEAFYSASSALDNLSGGALA